MADSLDLDAIQQRVDAATPGPWTITGDGCNEWIAVESAEVPDFDGYGDVERIAIVGVDKELQDDGEICRALEDDNEATNASDLEFIAHAREDVPALIAEIRRLRTEQSQDDRHPTTDDPNEVGPVEWLRAVARVIRQGGEFRTNDSLRVDAIATTLESLWKETQQAEGPTRLSRDDAFAIRQMIESQFTPGRTYDVYWVSKCLRAVGFTVSDE